MAEPPVFPFPTSDPLEPPPEYAKLAPVTRATLPSGDPVWLVARHSDVRRLLSDQRFSREAITAPGAPRLLPIAQGSKSIFVMDPPEHTRLRGLVSKAFAPRRIEALRGRVQAIADGLVDDMIDAGPPADLIAGFAQPLPITVICELLGVPFQDVARFREWTDLMLSFDPASRDQVIEARNRLAEYLLALIAEKRRQGGEDLLTVLVHAHTDDDRLTEEELLAFGYTLLGAGYHATTTEIVHSVLHLLRAPDALDALRKDPESLPTAVEELLRISQAGGGLGALRIATEDVRVGEVTIRAGEAVLPLINAANRDPEAFPDPDRMDLHRSPNQHVAFGHGIHHCLGAQLGRMELQVALGTLLRRMPELRLAVDERDLVWNSGVAFKRPDTLPISW